MRLDDPVRALLRRPGVLALRTLKAYRANQGLLLAGAVAYYALLSLVPLLILIVVALSHVVDPAELLSTIQRYLEWLVPGQSRALVDELSNFMAQRQAVGWLLLATMLFFSSLAFTALENAMALIFHHRVPIRRRHFAVSALLPYAYILSLGVGLLITSLVAGSFQVVDADEVELFGRPWPLHGLAGLLLYLLGVCGEVMILTAVYLVMPVGRPSWRHALIGAAIAAVLWELTRHALVWYLATLSQISVVYGSLTTAIAALFGLEMAAALLLLGAQVVAEFERASAERSSPAHRQR